MRYLLYGLLLMSMVACRPYPFAKKSHFVNGVDEYFNFAHRLNVWVYMDFLKDDGVKDYGVRMDSLYPEDRAVFEHIGIKKRTTRVLFSALPKNRLGYHFVALLHRKNNFDYSAYQKFQGKESFYYYKDFEKDFLAIRHVVIPYEKDKLVSLVYYLDKDKNLRQPFRPLNYLAEINARELQNGAPLNTSWQVFDCDDTQLIPATFKIRQKLTQKSKFVYLKMYTLYPNGREINYAQIIQRQDPDSISLKLCPNDYVLEYVTPSGELLQRDSLSIGM